MVFVAFFAKNKKRDMPSMVCVHVSYFFGGAQQIRTAVDGFADRYLTTRSGHQKSFFRRGAQQIRTAVDGFADRYLTTRSGHHFCFANAKVQYFFYIATFSLKNFLICTETD